MHYKKLCVVGNRKSVEYMSCGVNTLIQPGYKPDAIIERLLFYYQVLSIFLQMLRKMLHAKQAEQHAMPRLLGLHSSNHYFYLYLYLTFTFDTLQNPTYYMT